MESRANVLVFEDEAKPVKLLASALASLECDARIWRSASVRQAPTLFESGSAEEWSASREAQFSAAAAVVVDIELLGSDCQCEFCASENHGLHVLVELEALGCLHKAFIASAQLSKLRRKHQDYYERVASFLGRGVSVFENKNRPEELARKIAAWVRFDELGYYADFDTREKLYLVGQRGREVRPEHVLIIGASGTGKQRAAEFIHDVGRVAGSPARLEPVLCGGLVEPSLAKSQLFGHVVGAYTGAVTHNGGLLVGALGWRAPKTWDLGDQKRRPDTTTDFTNWFLEGTVGDRPASSVFSAVPGGLQVSVLAPVGTVFLDEFQDLPAEAQALLMRVIEQGEMEPLGFNGRILLRDKTGRPHLRFMGATNDEQIRRQLVLRARHEAPDTDEASSVRQDLVSRLSDWIIELKGVTPEEARFLVAQELSLRGLTTRWHEDAITALQEQIQHKHFPGNRRQVRQLILRASALAAHESASGRLLDPVAEVLRRHVEDASLPIRPSARPHQATELDEAAFVGQVIDLMVDKIQARTAGFTDYLTKAQYDELERALLTDMRDAFGAMKTTLDQGATVRALELVAERVVERLESVFWETKTMFNNKSRDKVPKIRRLLLEAAEEAGKVLRGTAGQPGPKARTF